MPNDDAAHDDIDDIDEVENLEIHFYIFSCTDWMDITFVIVEYNFKCRDKGSNT